MNTKTLSNRALSVIDQYLHFKVGNAVCTVPYFNNKTVGARFGIRALVGKGSPKDIFEEVESVAVKNHVAIATLTDESLKKILVDNNLGIDCSAFAYYVLNAESEENGKGAIDKHITFTSCKGFLGKVMCSLRPVENCDVATFSHDKNSHVIPVREIKVADMITMIGSDRNHILIIHQVEYQNFIPTRVHYSHAFAYPEDGVYGTGIKQGVIEIVNTVGTITDQRWITSEKDGSEDIVFSRAKKVLTEVRRLRWF